MARILTGIKPTGKPHLGNYLGAIRPAIALANEPGNDALYFIADYHALTTTHDGAQLDELTRDVAATWLAFGLDPEKTLFYRQSDILEVFELSWILSCFTSKGWMNKMHAYKARLDDLGTDVQTADTSINMGLFGYPILMAADIMLYDADLVPVGKDQVQHVEIARDMAQRINHVYKAELLRLPAAKVDEQTAVVPGLDGRKMSKSYDNTIPLFAPPKQVKKLVNKIVTDASPPDAPKDPDTSNIFQLYKLFATPEQTKAMREHYVSGIGWGDAKAALFDVIEATLAGPRAKYEVLMADRAGLDAQLARGAERARVIAGATIERLRKATGIRR